MVNYADKVASRLRELMQEEQDILHSTASKWTKINQKLVEAAVNDSEESYREATHLRREVEEERTALTLVQEEMNALLKYKESMN